ncbi:MAG: S-layer homology domain-containing protein [Acidobacteriota bacterium]
MNSDLAVTALFEPLPSAAALAADAHAGEGSAGDLNGVLEPGEIVRIEPAWTNGGSTALALAGTATSFTGPTGATYSLVDAAASYGTIAAGATGDCDAAGNCYVVQLSDPATRPAGHWDVTLTESLGALGSRSWTVHVGESFADVPPADAGYRFVETVFHNGVTAGCGAAAYCPAGVVTRWQMAVFLAKAMLGPDVPPPVSGTANGLPFSCTSGGTSVFADVPPTDAACPHVHYIYDQGVTSGCGAGVYCPMSEVSRWQMAVFLAKAMLGPGVPPPVSGTANGESFSCTGGGVSLFTDVPPTDAACPHVHYIYDQDVTAGCGTDTYCPATTVTRWQMAVFLTKAFDLLLYGP